MEPGPTILALVQSGENNTLERNTTVGASEIGKLISAIRRGKVSICWGIIANKRNPGQLDRVLAIHHGNYYEINTKRFAELLMGSIIITPLGGYWHPNFPHMSCSPDGLASVRLPVGLVAAANKDAGRIYANLGFSDSFDAPIPIKFPIVGPTEVAQILCEFKSPYSRNVHTSRVSTDYAAQVAVSCELLRVIDGGILIECDFKTTIPDYFDFSITHMNKGELVFFNGPDSESVRLYGRKSTSLKTAYYGDNDIPQIGCKLFCLPDGHSCTGGVFHYHYADGKLPTQNLPTICRGDGGSFFVTRHTTAPELDEAIDEFENKVFLIDDGHLGEEDLPTVLAAYKEMVGRILASGNYAYHYWKLMGYRSTFFPRCNGFCALYNDHCRRLIESVPEGGPEFEI